MVVFTTVPKLEVVDLQCRLLLRCRSEPLFGDFKSVSARQDVEEDVPARIGSQKYSAAPRFRH